jgi:hypothetical protein
MINTKSGLHLALWLILGCAAGYIMIAFPPHADEFSKYQRLACFSFEGSVFSTLQNGCDKYLASFFGFQFHKNYEYFGVTSNFLYAPFYFLFPSIYSHYIFGFIALLAFAGLMVKALNLNAKALIIPLAFFPLLYSFIHDIGPISLAMLSYPAFILAISRLLNPRTSVRSIVFWLGIAFLMTLLSLEDKAFFIYLLPQILLISLAASIYLDKSTDSTFAFLKVRSSIFFLRRAVLLGLVIFIAAAIVLLLIRVDGMTYYQYLKGLRAISLREYPITQWEIFHSIRNFLITPILMIHRTIIPNEFSVWISRLLWIPILAIAGFHTWRTKSFALTLILLSDVVLGCIYIYSQNVWASHHFIFLFIPILIILMLSASSSKNAYYLVISALLLNLVGNIALAVGQPIASHSSPSRAAVFSYLSNHDVARNSIINFSSAGGYSIQALYGDKNQIVVWTPLKSDHAGDKLLEILTKSGRQSILNVCDNQDDCSYQLLKAQFPYQTIQKIGPENSSWWIWEIKP